VRTFWPPVEAAQADYEQLRAAVIGRCPLTGPTAARFEAQGLWGLIRRPATPAVFTARLWGATRPPWTPYSDPRLSLLADAYQVVLSPIHPDQIEQEQTGT
jgi:hypothetical protein